MKLPVQEVPAPPVPEVTPPSPATAAPAVHDAPARAPASGLWWSDAVWPWRLLAFAGLLLAVFVGVWAGNHGPRRYSFEVLFVLLFQTGWLVAGVLACAFLRGRLRLLAALVQLLVYPFLIPVSWYLLLGDTRYAVLAGMVLAAGCIVLTPWFAGAAALGGGLVFAAGLKHFCADPAVPLPFALWLQLAGAYVGLGVVAVAWRWLLVRLRVLMTPQVVTTTAAAETEELGRLRQEIATLTEERQTLRAAVALHVATLNCDAGFVRGGVKSGQA